VSKYLSAFDDEEELVLGVIVLDFLTFTDFYLF
jgi:hypothetical protein